MTSFGIKTTGAEVVEHFQNVVQGKIIVITGASVKGLGAATAIDLARASPAQLILLGRSLEKIQPVMDEISQIDPKIAVQFVAVELDKPRSIESAAQKVCSLVSRIDILINNAGIMATPYSKSEAGIESQFATNHIGHFMFTNLVMDKIKAAKGARIVNLTSTGYKLAPVFFDDWNFSDGKTYHEWSGYGQSKTANILFTKYLAKHLAKDGVVAYAVHPGAIADTALADNMDRTLFGSLDEISRKNTGDGFEIIESEWKTVEEGVSTTLVAALDDRILGSSGAYLQNCIVTDLQRDYAASDENVERLWKLSEEIVGQKYKI